MDQHGLVLTGHYDPYLVTLSVVFAILSAYAALDLAGRVTNARGRARFAWLAGGAAAMGNGIWSMHYVGMLAFRLPVASKYDWPTVLVSLMAAVLASGVALFVVSRPTMRAPAIVAGSLFMGAGIAAMHYIGMAAMRLPAMCSYSTPLVLLSIVLAVGISFVALWRTFALRDSLDVWSYSKAADAVILGAAIPVMHYVGMSAVTFRKAPLAASSLKHATGISQLGLVSIILVTLATLSLVYLTSIVDRSFSRQALDLEGSEQRYRRIVESTFDAFLAIHQDGSIMDWNARGEAMFGWKRDEAIGMSIDGLIFLSGAGAAERRGLATLLAPGEMAPLVDRVEATASRRDGSEFPVEIALSSFQWRGKPMFAAFVHDVTRRKTAEKEREEARAAAEAGSRAKSEFLANMSHEIRTPLNGVIGMTDLALESELTTEQRECLETVKFSADALLDVINDILDFSKIEAGKIEMDKIPFDLGECIEGTLKTLALRADEKGLELLCDVAPEVPEMVMGDPGRLRQIVTNLVSNAIKFTNEGEVALRVHADHIATDAATLHFVVSDTGIGIAADKVEAIFESFVQADASTTRKYGGTGLGLTISKRLTELMEGRIWVESELNRGSHFHFTARFQRADAPAPGSSLSSGSLTGVTVLVIDDNRTNRRILERLLANWAMKPTVASSGRQALEILGEASKSQRRFDLILTDMHMPEMDGFGLVEAIQSGGGSPAATIMMLSSAGHRGDAARCRELGIASYLLKPVRQTELRQAIERVLGARNGTTAPAMVTRDLLQQEHNPASSLNILLAEDNEVNQRLAVRLIERRGHRVFPVSNGREALSALESSQYDLVLMDVQMPEMDGIEATLALREKEKLTGSHQPIVAMTALVMSGDRERCLDAGMDGYLAKPIRARELDDILESYGTKRKDSHCGSGSAPPPHGNRGVEPAAGDAIHLDELLERVEGDRVFLSELAEIFRKDCPRQIESISDAIARQDSQGVKRASHALRGALSNLAAVRARDMAAALERMAIEGDLTAARPALLLLQEELNRVVNSLDALCRETVHSKILIADDDSISRHMMERMLRRAGYEVTIATDGGEAVEQLLSKDAPRLALLDWIMPVMDGLEVCRELRRLPERAYTYIALLTSKEAKEDLIAGLEAGADDYLTKPCNLHELTARLRTGQRILRMEDTLVEAREGMRFKAMHDPLTSLWNRGAIVAHLETEINCTQLGGNSLSVLLCDVDHFKLINDRHGHLVGDAVLREIAARLTASVRPGDMVGRYGGEEFLILLRDCGEREIGQSADRVRLGVCSYPIAAETEPLPLSVSIGAMTIKRLSNCGDIQSVLGRVDAALYLAKAGGRNQVVASATGAAPEASIDVPSPLALPLPRHSQTRLQLRAGSA